MAARSQLPASTRKVLRANGSVPLREQTVKILRDAILNLELKPGQRLVEREFITSLGISRTTFREALRELSTEGLVSVVAQKGARVSEPSRSEAADLYRVRAALEAILMRRFVERASDEQVNQLSKAIEDFEKVVAQTTDTRILLESKNAYYQVLVEGAQSAVLEQILTGVRARAHSFRSRTLSVPGRAAQNAAELRHVLEAVIARDADAAAARCEEDIRAAGDLALANLEK